MVTYGLFKTKMDHSLRELNWNMTSGVVLGKCDHTHLMLLFALTEIGYLKLYEDMNMFFITLIGINFNSYWGYDDHQENYRR